MTEESDIEITNDTFVADLLTRVPEARGVCEEHLDTFGELLLHLLMADLLRFAVECFQVSDRETLDRLLIFIDRSLRHGDSFVENAVQASFIENVGASPEETPEFITSWPLTLKAERIRQINWRP